MTLDRNSLKQSEQNSNHVKQPPVSFIPRKLSQTARAHLAFTHHHESANIPRAGKTQTHKHILYVLVEELSDGNSDSFLGKENQNNRYHSLAEMHDIYPEEKPSIIDLKTH